MGLYVHQSANLAGFVAGCHTGDLDLIRRSFADLVVEPHRAPLIQGFAAVKAAALEAGALGCSISGAGPSVFAWCVGEAAAAAARDAMVAGFSAAGVESDAFVSPVNAPGARVVEAA
jgi:homoserine kinase